MLSESSETSNTPAPSCLFCEQTHTLPYLSTQDTQGNDYHYHRCAHCQTISITPLPSPSVLSAAYSEAYYGQKETKFAGLVERIIDYFRAGRSRYALRFLRQGNTILDIGCGNGQFLHHLSQQGSYKLHGIEPPGKSYERASKLPGITITCGFLSVDSFPRHSIDLITMYHVLEHVPNPHETLRTISTQLRPGGHAIISFPNISSWQTRLFRRHWLHLDPPRHLSFFPAEAFPTIAQQFDLDVIDIHYLSLEQNPFSLVQSTFNAIGLPRDLLYERLKGNLRYAPHHGRISTFIQKATAIILSPLAVLIDIIESCLKRSATVQFTLKRR